jgi:sugar/nucleoside kinase (ribokinase family)
MSEGILAGGNWIVDKLKFVDVYPEQDALANILRQSIGNGGSPFNILIDLALLGAHFPLAGIGLIGRDADGAWISERCARHGIDTAQLRIHPTAPTSYTDVMTVQSTGRRTFFHQRGANAFLDGEHFEFDPGAARIFHLGYLLLLDRLDGPDAEFGTMAARTLFRARQAGLKTSIDVVSEDSSRFAQVVLPALPYVDYCILNEFELGRTTGLAVRKGEGIDFPTLHAAASRLLEAGVHEWVIVHFLEGACALGRDGRLRRQESLLVPQADIVSTVGAGDAFAAGVLYGLHENVEIEEALRFGICAAASCLHGAGTSDGVRPLGECLSLTGRYKIRSGTEPTPIDR